MKVVWLVVPLVAVVRSRHAARVGWHPVPIRPFIRVIATCLGAMLALIALFEPWSHTYDIGSGTTGTGIVDADSGAGNVVVRLPSGIATSGLGNVVVDPGFGKVDSKTYQPPDDNSAANKVEITVNGGAGNVSVNTK